MGRQQIPINDDMCDPDYLEKLDTAFKDVRDDNDKLVPERLEACCLAFREMCSDVIPDSFPVESLTDDMLQEFCDN